MAYEYTVLGQTVKLEVDPSVVAVKFSGAQPHSVRARATDAAGIGPFSKRYEIPGENLTIVPVTPIGSGPTSARGLAMPQAAISALNSQPEVAQALPVFRLGGNHIVATDRVIVGFNDSNARDTVASKHGLTKLSERDDKVVFRIPDGADPFQICALIETEAGVRFSEPDFVTIGRHVPKRVAPTLHPLLSDPLIKRQYAVHLTRATEAWNLQQGVPSVRIAILDEGVDTRHPDLASSVVGTFDAGDGDSYQEPNPWDGHGTACAGLAAAKGDAASGVVGVGTGCSILAVRIASSEFQGGPWVTTNEKIARAISWCWQSGASVLSNSWGGGAPSNAIAEEFENARLRGRGGLGCVVVIAAGNSFNEVSFPGTVPNMLVISASNEYDEAKTPSSRDGESWWGTCYGPQISIAAPGVHNLTTDISGTSGYSSGDYEEKFNGTSSSTPIVAGACGLIISANPNLSEADVRRIICETAEKVGPYPYDASGRNDFFGFGRLNVMAAVQSSLGIVS